VPGAGASTWIASWIESMALRPYWGHSRHFGAAPDHPWVRIHPDFYVQGDEAALSAAPHNYTRVETGAGPGILAYGRDPNFPGWPDTLQLDYCNPELQAARVDELLAIAAKCDSRCDMAMLLLPEIIQRTWGMTPEPFWPKATAAVHAKYPGFIFMAEVYWDLEWTLQQQGFAYCYDKRQYDRLKASAAGRSAITFSPDSIIRTSLRASSKTTTSRGQRLDPLENRIGRKRKFRALATQQRAIAG
jgi:hypothetical protein